MTRLRKYAIVALLLTTSSEPHAESDRNLPQPVEGDAASQLDPIVVNPHYDDPLYKSDLRLKKLLNELPGLGGEPKKADAPLIVDIGKFLLYQITPLQPELREFDPPPGPIDLSPEAVSAAGADKK